MTAQEENKIANDWLLNYHYKVELYQSMINNFSEIAATQYTGMPQGSGTSDPCQNKAISLTEMEKYKNWIIVIELVESMLNDKSREFLRLWRIAEIEAKSTGGRPGWYNEVRNKYSEFFQKRYGKYFLPSNQTLKDWRMKLIEVTVRLAIRKGLL